MGLNFNIPMPDIANSFSKGFGLTDNLMKQILERNQLKQKAAHEKEALEQAEKHFQLNYGLSKAAAGRAAQSAADAHKKSIHDLDPLSKARDWEALENYFKSKASQGNNAQQESMPTEEFGQGRGVFNPQGLDEAQQQEHPQQEVSHLPGGVTNQDLALMKQFPALRGLYKKNFGVDPLASVPQTPEEKQAAALDLFKQKEGIKAQNKGGDTPTDAVLTQNQHAIQGIDTVLPMLDDLIKNPGKVYGKWDFSPSKKAAYNAKTSGMIDTLVAAQSLPKVQASIDLVEQQIRRATNESDSAYIDRIKDLRKDLVNRRGKAQYVIKNRRVNTESSDDYSNMSDEELRKIAGGG